MNPFDPQQQVDMPARYIVEAKDEYGWFDDARFATKKGALNHAKRHQCPVRVIDSREQVCLYEAGI